MIKNIQRQYQKNRFYDGITQGYLLILNILDCIMEIILAGTGVIFFLLYTLSNGRAYDVMLPQEGTLS